MTENYWHMKPDKSIAIQMAKRQLPEFVHDAVNLEGINMTLPEIQTLLDGVTIGGHKLSDVQITLNQAKTWKALFDMVKEDRFELSAETVCNLHAIAAKDEALTHGEFRYTSVFITGTDYMPPDAEKLPGLFNEMVDQAAKIKDVYERSFYVFLNMARNQYFFDVNKRTGRFMMNGLLLDAGYPAVNVSAKRQMEFNQKMIDFFENNTTGPMNDFLRSCLDKKLINIMEEAYKKSLTR
ncbi:MAG: Fic family protein [Nitrospina sp.]|nr:Fic family protein [Nitrospina sp.]